MLILVVPGDRLHVCDKVLAVQFKEKKAYRLSHPESVEYKQVVSLAFDGRDESASR